MGYSIHFSDLWLWAGVLRKWKFTREILGGILKDFWIQLRGEIRLGKCEILEVWKGTMEDRRKVRGLFGLIVIRVLEVIEVYTAEITEISKENHF